MSIQGLSSLVLVPGWLSGCRAGAKWVGARACWDLVCPRPQPCRGIWVTCRSRWRPVRGCDTHAWPRWRNRRRARAGRRGLRAAALSCRWVRRAGCRCAGRGAGRPEPVFEMERRKRREERREERRGGGNNGERITTSKKAGNNIS